MSLGSDMQQNIQTELNFSSTSAGEAREAGREETELLPATNDPESPARTNRWMEEVCERENLKEALRRVKANKGSAGIDRMTVDGIADYLKQHWPAIREQLLSGTYQPKPVRRVEIPKPDGGVRQLGIPTVLDRFIQQAAMQAAPIAVGAAIVTTAGQLPAKNVIHVPTMEEPGMKIGAIAGGCSTESGVRLRSWSIVWLI